MPFLGIDVMSTPAIKKETKPDLEIRDVWQQAIAPDVVQIAEALWRGLTPGRPKEIELRVKNLCAVVYNGGKIVAASSAQPIEFGKLLGRFFYYRAGATSSVRPEDFDVKLAACSKEALERWSRENPGENMKGIVMVLDTDEFGELRSNPVIRDAGLDAILIGYTDQRHQIRTIWFDHVKLEK